jgi:hypothetical protein
MLNLLFVSSVYVLCEIIKAISFNERTYNYDSCMKLANDYVFPIFGDAGLSEEVCANKWGVSTLASFTYGLPISLMIIHTLYGDVMKRYTGYPYWIVVHLSVMIYSYLQKIKEFNFSIDSDMNGNYVEISILILIGVLSCCVIIWNLIYTSISHEYLLLYGLIYTFILVSFWVWTHEIKFHIHHSLLCTFLSYFVTDWGYNFNKYVHGILLGITIQGLNFYRLDSFHLFYISYTIYPNIYHLIFLYSTIIMASVMIIASRSRIIRGGAEGSTIAEDRA